MYYFKDQQEYQAYLCRRQLRSDVNGLGVLLLIFFFVQMVLGLGISFVVGLTGTETYFYNGNTMTLLFNGVYTMLSFFLVSAIYCCAKKLSFARLFPFERVGAGMLAAFCTVGLTFSLMSNYAVSLLTDVFSLFGLTNRGGEIVDGSGSLPSIPIFYLTVALLPALAEEFAFRGVIMGALRRHSDALALLVSSAAFALMHGNFVQMPFTFCCGLVFGFIAIKTNSLLPTIIIHFLNNALSVTGDVMLLYNVMSVTQWNFLFHLLILVLCVVSIFLIRMLVREKPEMFTFPDSDMGIPFRNKLKAAASSPTMISFAVIMVLFSLYVLVK